MSKLFYVIYKTTSKINGNRQKFFYIGKQETFHPSKEKYLGEYECYGLRKAIIELGRENFTRTNLFIFTKKEDMERVYNEIYASPRMKNNKNMYRIEYKNDFKRKRYNESPRPYLRKNKHDLTSAQSETSVSVQ